MKKTGMTEEEIIIHSGKIKIEGLLKTLPGDKGVIISHPHPQHGGDMHNQVVEAVCMVYQEKGYGTLRFNFRGVGQSEGEYDEGISEQDDVEAALVYFADLGKKELDLVGYSFGSWVNALGLNKYKKVKRVIMISPPVDLLDFSSLRYNPKIKLVITGSEDEIADWKSIKKMIPSWNREAALRVIKGADHFYWGKTGELEEIIREFLEQD
jgi:alpha/beta superfamily hydrolase